MNQEHEMDILFPGREVKIQTAKGEQTVIVYPMSIQAFRKFKDACINLIDVFNNAGGTEILGGGWQSILPVLIPIIVDDYLDILAECVDGLDLLHKRCPQHIFPVIAKAWLFESFGEERKLRPWTDLIDEVLTKVTNEKVDLWPTLVSSLSRTDTENPKLESMDSANSNSTSKPSKTYKVRKPRKKHISSGQQ